MGALAVASPFVADSSWLRLNIRSIDAGHSRQFLGPGEFEGVSNLSDDPAESECGHPYLKRESEPAKSWLKWKA